jgi:hypothetical protein
MALTEKEKNAVALARERLNAARAGDFARPVAAAEVVAYRSGLYEQALADLLVVLESEPD